MLGEYGLKRGAEKFPLMVVASVSYACNAHCPNCPYTQSQIIRRSYHDTPFMLAATFKRIADECGRHGAWIRITGGGEPLLHPQILDLIKYAKWVGARVGLITNGSLLDEKTVENLLVIGTDAIEISADAADEQTYAKIRCGLDFTKLVENATYLRAMRDASGLPTRIIASVINQKAIEGQVDSIVAYWEQIADSVQVRKFLTWGIGDEGESGDAKPYIGDHRTPCPFPFERLNVDSRGKVEFCGFDIAGDTDFGNVNEERIEDIWRGEKFEEWRRLLLDGKYGEIEVCSKCPDWKYRSWDHNYWKVLEKAGGSLEV